VTNVQLLIPSSMETKLLMLLGQHWINNSWEFLVLFTKQQVAWLEFTSVTAQNTATKFAKNSIGTTYKEVNTPDLFLVLWLAF